MTSRRNACVTVLFLLSRFSLSFLFRFSVPFYIYCYSSLFFSLSFCSQVALVLHTKSLVSLIRMGSQPFLLYQPKVLVLFTLFFLKFNFGLCDLNLYSLFYSFIIIISFKLEMIQTHFCLTKRKKIIILVYFQLVNYAAADLLVGGTIFIGKTQLFYQLVQQFLGLSTYFISYLTQMFAITNSNSNKILSSTSSITKKQSQLFFQCRRKLIQTELFYSFILAYKIILFFISTSWGHDVMKLN